ncbi:MAG: SRPBCC family protein [Acidimicrobiia bacterium]
MTETHKSATNAPLRLVVVLDASPARVWAELADLRSHAEWMGDAGTVELVTDRTQGVGTQMRVPTRVGPLRVTDLMTVVEWDEGRVIGVEHMGAVSGVGRFEIRPSGSGTELTWTETLTFPWWLGARLGARVARPLLRRIWGKNLERLRHRVEGQRPSNSA